LDNTQYLDVIRREYTIHSYHGSLMSWSWTQKGLYSSSEIPI